MTLPLLIELRTSNTPADRREAPVKFRYRRHDLAYPISRLTVPHRLIKRVIKELLFQVADDNYDSVNEYCDL